jgi:stage II sporulation protein D
LRAGENVKKTAYTIFFIFVAIIIIPVAALKFYNNEDNKKNSNNPQEILKGTSTIKVYFHEQDKVEDIDFEEYLKGVVAAEMPASFGMEALKAQAVAARTYTLLKVLKPQESIVAQHKGAYICTNFAHCQAWTDKGQLKDTWGTINFNENYKKISKAVEETNGLIITYNNEVIDPLFHSTSGGKTENSEEVFSAKLPYLRSIISQGEEASPKFASKAIISFNEFKEKLKELSPNIKIEKKDVKSIKVLEYSEGGRVKKIQIGNKIFSGKEIRSVFSLNSSNFNIKLEKNNIIFNTVGYGHGVGMSQFGANYLAKEGNNFEYILKYYYQGVQIINISQLKAQ